MSLLKYVVDCCDKPLNYAVETPCGCDDQDTKSSRYKELHLQSCLINKNESVLQLMN